jgi:hypothetical protein
VDGERELYTMEIWNQSAGRKRNNHRMLEGPINRGKKTYCSRKAKYKQNMKRKVALTFYNSIKESHIKEQYIEL